MADSSERLAQFAFPARSYFSRGLAAETSRAARSLYKLAWSALEFVTGSSASAPDKEALLMNGAKRKEAIHVAVRFN